MKTTCRLLCLLLLLATDGAVRAGNSDLKIDIVPKKEGQTGDRPPRSDTISASAKEDWSYEVTIENKTFKEMTNLEVKYVIFYKREKLGETGKAAMQRQSGSSTIASLKPREKQSFRTSSLVMKKASLDPDYTYKGAGREKAEDKLTGLWVRVYANGQQFAEYANPSTLARETWSD